MKKIFSLRFFKRILFSVMIICMAASGNVWAAGTLTPTGSYDSPVQIMDHSVNVTINNGFAITRVTQTFFNPNDRDLEAIYSFPLPKSASLSEVTITIGEKIIEGEVVEKDKAKKVYEEERDKGNESGMAEKNSYQDFRFYVSPVKANDKAVITFVYYQPLEIDTGMGRYVYPLEAGGTDDAAERFWTSNSKVEGMFSIEVDMKSAFPVRSVRAPGFNPVTSADNIANGEYKARYESPQGSLNRDFVFYYKLQDNLPGRVEVIPYKASKNKPGSFMMVITPGLDLKPLTNGADYIFVLDKSGSMDGKIQTLAKGVIQSLGKMRPEDRFRIITFDTNAREITKHWISATRENVEDWSNRIMNIHADGSTNLYDALDLCLEDIKNDDRATSVILVTDGVTNTGMVDPKEFHKLLQKYDIRIFGFLMGNSANWPLIRVICETSGGFYAGVSNSDDIIGQILKAKNKITHECLHHTTWKISGVKVYDNTDQNLKKVYHGQQLVLFGRYDKAGRATLTINARLTGQDKTYTTTFDFPETDTDNPEIERLWALNQVEQTELLMNTGQINPETGQGRIRKLGLENQLVTDETSMLVLSDESFKEHGIKRNNKARLALEHKAQAKRTSQPAKNYRVDRSKPAFNFKVPSFGGGGGGAVDPMGLLIAIGLGISALAGYRRRR
ncbi:MAG: VWA domain-containing protein [Spirochaetes bacterium]|nr:VWA domain-containing protein [Spirochaetota bacterium]